MWEKLIKMTFSKLMDVKRTREGEKKLVMLSLCPLCMKDKDELKWREPICCSQDGAKAADRTFSHLCHLVWCTTPTGFILKIWYWWKCRRTQQLRKHFECNRCHQMRILTQFLLLRTKITEHTETWGNSNVCYSKTSSTLSIYSI